jgi:hypothetical protein
MALYAILEIKDAFCLVPGCDAGWIVCVATITGVGRQIIRVACQAGTGASGTVIEREGVGLVELRRRPGSSGVTGSAVGAQQPLVKVGVGVAGNAIGGCAFEDVVDVALAALELEMSAGEREGGFAMVKGGIGPIVRGVACATILAELPLVSVIFLVAREAIGRGA